MDEIRPQLFKPGPLHNQRFELQARLRELPIKTGDIFFRLGCQSFLGIPFEPLVAHVTRSKYSHASIAWVVGDDIYLLEVNDMGTLSLRFIDWLDYCATDDFAVCRLPLTKSDTERVEKAIQDFLAADYDYDFTFAIGDKFYCTESVAFVFQQAGVPIAPPRLLRDITRRWSYWLIRGLNYLVWRLTGKTLPMDCPAYFVGNKENGIMSTPGITRIY